MGTLTSIDGIYWSIHLLDIDIIFTLAVIIRVTRLSEFLGDCLLFAVYCKLLNYPIMLGYFFPR
jgi:hypothetical protein